jgi:hypothetical protein
MENPIQTLDTNIKTPNAFRTKNSPKTFESCFFYKLLAKKQGIRFGVATCSVLAVPYLLIVLTYIIFNPNAFALIPLDLRFEIIFASSWFILGPILIFRLMKTYIGLKDEPEFTLTLRKWFRNNAENHYKFYKRCMAILGFVFVVLAVPILLYNPDILTKVARITSGYNSIHYWLILIFLSWFLVYSTNAISIITLVIKVIYSIIKYNVIEFNPTEYVHHKCIRKLISFCNKVVSYMCSGLFFLPIAFFFLHQRVYINWVTALLVFYSLFLFASITYPKSAIKSHIDKRSKDFLMNEKLQYFNDIKSDRFSIYRNKLELQLQRYNIYLYIQELKTVCLLKVKIDFNTIFTYFSIFAMIATSMQGFVDLYKIVNM